MVPPQRGRGSSILDPELHGPSVSAASTVNEGATFRSSTLTDEFIQTVQDELNNRP